MDLVGVDTETTGFDPHKDKVLTLQLGHKENQFVIDVTTIDILEFKEILESKQLILQNAKFDLRFFYKQGIFPNKIYDTFLAEVKLTQGILNHKRNLQALAENYCNTIEVDKSLRSLIHYKGLVKEVITYAANDVKFLHEIREKQLKKALEEGITLGIRRENRFVTSLAYAEYCGMYFEPTLWEKKVNSAHNKVLQYRKELNQFVINNNLSKYIDTQLDLFSTEQKVLINWNSDTQVKPLFKELGIDIVVYEKGVHKESIEAGILKKQEDKSPIIPIYLNYKKWEKDFSTYGSSFIKKISEETGRIHTSFTQIVNTGRMASGGKNKATREEYPNFQNIPATPEEKYREEGMVYARQCIKPQKGNVFVNADYSGQEQIVLVNKSQDKDLISFYKQKLGDMHSFVAEKIFPKLKGLPLSEIKKNFSTERGIAKKAGFALNYGGTGWTVANNVNIPHEEGNRVEKAYFDAFPDLKKYYDKCESLTLKNGYILIDDVTGDKFHIAGFDKLKQLLLEQSLRPNDYWKRFQEEKLKRTKWFKNEKEKNSYVARWKGQIRRLSLNMPIQGTSASITKVACIYFYDWILENNYQNIVKLVNIVHDEILAECPKELSKIVADKMKEFMEKAGDIYCKIIPLKAVPEISTFWNH
jgi:DNA polymerase-1